MSESKKSAPASFAEVIDLWPTVKQFAEENAVSYVAARAWKSRDSIPAPYWRGILETARKHRFPVTLALLAEIAESVPEEVRLTGRIQAKSPRR